MGEVLNTTKSTDGRAGPERALRGTLRRFIDDWVLPRWRQIAVALVLTSGLAATTGGYPLIIKYAFDTLLKGDASALPWVMLAIVVVTVTRSLIIYLHNVMTARIVARMMTDLQKAAFAHIINSDYARLTRETTGQMVSRLTNDLAFVQRLPNRRCSRSSRTCFRRSHSLLPCSTSTGC